MSKLGQTVKVRGGGGGEGPWGLSMDARLSVVMGQYVVVWGWAGPTLGSLTGADAYAGQGNVWLLVSTDPWVMEIVQGSCLLPFLYHVVPTS